MNAAAQGPRVRAYVAFGANLGEPVSMYARCCDALRALPATQLVACSRLYRSAPMAVDGEQPDYFNAVMALDTALPPEVLLSALLAIEAGHGRTRDGRCSARPIDLDLLLYGERHIDTARLQVPHPRMHQRAFVLLPLAELDPGLRIPGQPALATLIEALPAQRCHPLNPGQSTVSDPVVIKDDGKACA